MLNSFYDNGARLNSLTPTFIIEPLFAQTSNNSKFVTSPKIESSVGCKFIESTKTWLEK